MTRWAATIVEPGESFRVIMAVCVTLGGGVLKGAAVATHVTGAFDVKLTPQATDNNAEGPALGRMSIDKTYHGELEATGKGEMLTAGSSVKDSGVYVAVERVAGTLQGRRGTFALHHRGVMTSWRAAAGHQRRAGFRHWSARWTLGDDDHQHRRRQALLRVRLHDNRRALSSPTCRAARSRLAPRPSASRALR